ncbi:hypothetical protein CAEBREN_08913 [Caenorhabditis brenneri]|uniref:F-box domain-containing protein n=1 Tax=Caenorhabditis brenneri TaxID=135651 RepID=G0NCK6_CAEBE|nr:hypothetical protein CAEBREN_08913 [Caenorhabditis brenneri]
MSNLEPGFDTFPLLELPSLVYEMVILRMDVLEIFTFTFVSEDVFNTVKRLLSRNKQRHFVNGAVPNLEHLTLKGATQNMMEYLEKLNCEANPNRVLKTSPEDPRRMLTTPMDISQNGETIVTVFYSEEISPDIYSMRFLDFVKPSHTCTGPYYFDHRSCML